ncbi:PREDICTED: alpha-L-fucosidase 1-like [Nelumbo nucifera]|uniref:alpha-L-fucosidase n=1 Tax=Nelumbo nucifera TaxID=4432 RepID=A0A1U7Z4T1_NELNU|nr:PREDICTED: alpha-L-fucosidase 1-like [Nelumbo nucifera]
MLMLEQRCKHPFSLPLSPLCMSISLSNSAPITMKKGSIGEPIVQICKIREPISEYVHLMLFFLLLTFLTVTAATTTTTMTTAKTTTTTTTTTTSAPFSSSDKRYLPPLPILPIPSAPQLSWQLGDMALFLHFGTNTFTDSEWGTGHANPSIFNPTRLDARQWVRVAKDAGFSRVILTAKHHDGFCLWPSSYTDYSVRSSPWKNGTGDVLAELADAAREAGIGLGVYLSPWDRHETSYRKTLEYNEFYMGQMSELLTRYGEIKEVWLDGAKGEGEKDMEYFFDCWFSFIHQLQPGAVIFSDAGPDTRWVGDEAGVAGSTCWSLFNRSSAKIGDTDPQYLRGGDPFGHDWVPAECDVSIRPGWFWHASEVPKSAITLLDIYYKSVGRNCLWLLNIPPNSSGLISDEDVQVLQEFNRLRQTIFSHNLAKNAIVNASSTRGGFGDSQFGPLHVLEESIYTYWAPEEDRSDWIIYLDLGEIVPFNMIQVQEPIHMGQRIMAFHLDVQTGDGEWQTVINGTTVGYRRLLLFPRVQSQWLRFVIDKSRAEPLISFLGIYLDPFSVVNDASNTSSPPFNGSHVVQLTAYNHSLISTT